MSTSKTIGVSDEKVKPLLAVTFYISCGLIGLLVSHFAQIVFFQKPVEISPSTITMGRIIEGNVGSATVFIINRTKHRIDIDKIVPSCGCTTTKQVNSVRAEDRMPIQINFDSTGRPGRFSKLVNVFLKGDSKPIAFEINGNVLEPVTVLPPSIDLGSIAIGTASRKQSVTIFRGDLRKMHLSVRQANGFNVYLPKVNQAASELVSINVPSRLSIRKMPGEYLENVLINTNQPDVPFVRIPVVYKVLSEYKFVPADANFGYIKKSKDAVMDITLTGSLAGSLELVSFPSWISVTTTKTSENSADLSIKIRTTKGGVPALIDSKILLRTRNPKQPSLELPIYGVLN